VNTRARPTLEAVCDFIVDCLHNTAPLEDTGYPSIRTPNVGKGRLLLEGVNRVSEETYLAWTRRAAPEPGDLILAREAPAGNVAIIKEGERVCLGQRTVHIRPDRSIVDPDFLCYLLLAPSQQGKLLSAETGATAKHVNMLDIRRLALSYFPTLKTQQAIGSVLAQYDDLIENNNQRIKLLEQSARLLYQEWFVRLRFPGYEHSRIVDGVPVGWERKPLGATVTLNYGKALKAEDRIEGEFPVYGSSGIVGSHDKALVLGPAIILGRKGNVGSVFWSAQAFHPIDTVYFVNPESSSLYLYYALKGMHFISTDVAVPGLNRDFAYSRLILGPTPSLLRAFLDIVTPVHAQIDTLTQLNQKLRTARDLLLPRLMSGEITV
jgi:type I restriction enzyme, S subunit